MTMADPTAVYAGELLPAPAGVGGVLDVGAPDRLGRLVAEWLIAVARSEHTLRAYQGDAAAWFGWCAGHGVDPLAPTRTDGDVWMRWLAVTPNKRTGRPLRQATQARRVSTVASLYAFLVDEEAVTRSPIRSRGRPQAPRDSSTVGLSLEETRAFLARLPQEPATDRAIVSVLVFGGLRVGELVSLDVDSIGWNAGDVVARFIGKGGRERQVTLAPPAADAIGVMLDERAAKAGIKVDDLDEQSPLFVTVAGGRWTQRSVMRAVQRIARAAGIPSWRSLSPHSMRHACATMMLDAGVELHVVADHLGHRSDATTRRYDRARGKRTGAAKLAAYLTDGEG